MNQKLIFARHFFKFQLLLYLSAGRLNQSLDLFTRLLLGQFLIFVDSSDLVVELSSWFGDLLQHVLMVVHHFGAELLLRLLSSLESFLQLKLNNVKAFY